MTSQTAQLSAGLVTALVDLRLGSLLTSSSGDDPDLLLEDLASITPELFATDRVSWELIFGRLQSSAAQAGFQDVVMVSVHHVYILLRSSRDRDVGLVGVAPRTRNVGLALAEARTRLRQIEEGA